MNTPPRPGWVVLAASVVLIAIVALTSRSALSVPAIALPDGAAVVTPLEVIAYVALGIGIAVLPLWLAMRRSRRPAETATPREDALGVATWRVRLIGLAVIVLIILAETAVWSRLLDDLGGAPMGDGLNGGLFDGWLDPGEPRATSGSATALIIAAVILGAIALASAAMVVKWRIVDRPSARTGAERRRATEEAIEVSLDALRREPDPRRAVIAAYAAMERSMDRAGFGRVRSEAPLEYLRRVLDVSGLAEEHLRTVTMLFQHARFSEHPVPESMRAQAVEALAGVRAAVGVRG